MESNIILASALDAEYIPWRSSASASNVVYGIVYGSECQLEVCILSGRSRFNLLPVHVEIVQHVLANIAFST